jgi:predicted nucleic acid-binding protein
MTKTPMTMVVVDTSVWVSRLVPQDAHHEASKRWLDEFSAQKGQIVAPVLLLLEVAGAISRRTGEPSLAHQAVKQLQRPGRLRLVPIDRRLGLIAAQLAGDLGLRGADAAYVAVAHHLGIPLLTWDEDQTEKAGKAIQVLFPESG